jgi:hypothetical protein
MPEGCAIFLRHCAASISSSHSPQASAWGPLLADSLQPFQRFSEHNECAAFTGVSKPLKRLRSFCSRGNPTLKRGVNEMD